MKTERAVSVVNLVLMQMAGGMAAGQKAQSMLVLVVLYMWLMQHCGLHLWT